MNSNNKNDLKTRIKNYFNLFNKGTKTMFKEFFKKDTNKKQRANMWTFIRIITPFLTLICSIIAIITNLMPLFITSGIIAGFGAFTDFMDGRSSRKHNSESEYGKLLDQVSDKLFAGIIGINLSFINPIFLITLLGELSIMLTNISYKIKHNDLDIKSTKIGKIKEWPLFFTLAIGYLSPINNIILSISTISIILTLILQTLTVQSYVISNNKEIKKIEKNKIFNINNELNNNYEKKYIKKIDNNKKRKNDFLSQKEELIKFKNELQQMSENKNLEETNGYQKIKK